MADKVRRALAATEDALNSALDHMAAFFIECVDTTM